MLDNKFSILISVVIPSFNRANVLPRAIESVLQQTYPYFEILIVDDGSTDETKDLVQRYSAPSIYWIKHESNQGAAAARNSGIKAAKGKYIAFLDSDDEWLPKKLETQLGLMEASDPAVAASFTGFMLNRLDRNLKEQRPLAPIKNWRKYLIDCCNLSPGSTLMVKREAFAKVGYFDERLNRFEDWEWLFRLTEHYQIRGLRQMLSLIHLGEWPGVEVVKKSLANFKQYISEPNSSLSLSEKQNLSIMLDMEMSVAYWKNDLKIKGILHLLGNFCRSPLITLKFILKIIGRRIDRLRKIEEKHTAIFVENAQTAMEVANQIQQKNNLSDIVALPGLKKKLLKKPFAYFLKYQNGILVLHSLMTSQNILLLILTLRFMCQGSLELYDSEGQYKKINLKVLLYYVSAFLKDYAKKRAILRETQKTCQQLSQSEAIGFKTVDLKQRPLYLRTDLVFGLKAGGSVGHIAGVLNNLDKFCGSPIFITTDKIPTVREDIESFQMALNDLCWNMPEVANYALNEALQKFVRTKIQNQSIAFVYQRYSQGNISGLSLARDLKVPYICEFNGSELWIAKNWGTPLRYARLAALTEKTNLEGADLIVVVSDALKNALISQGIAANKILVNPNGVDVERYHPDISGLTIRKQLGIEKDFVIGFIGTFGAWHGAPELALAFGQLQAQGLTEGLKLMLIGDGNTLAETRQNITRFKAEASTIFTGIIPQEAGPEYMAACDLLVSPHIPNPDGSPFFGSPTKLFEYMAMGKPILASNLDQIGQILKHNDTAWLVKPGDVNKLMAGILSLQHDKELCIKLGSNARREAVEKHSWLAHTARIIEHIKTES